MGTVDIVTKEYMRENAIFADAFNYLIYGGKKVIDPAGLTEIDTATSAVGKKDALQKYRDVLKAAVIKQDEKMSYVLLGVENQTDVHYAMPVRNAIYDALQYGKQVSDIAAGHRRSQKDYSGKTGGEYLSGFLKEDHIKPVITLVIHFGAEEWDGPLSLHEMMPIRDMEILSYVENYRIHLIDPAKLTEEELNKFSTSMREVMGYIKYSNNKEKLLDFLRTDTHKSIEMNAARVIKTITKTPIKISEEKEGIEMCQAIEELIAESEARGEVRGKAEGMIEMCLEMNIPKKGIIKRLQDKLNISMQQVVDSVNQEKKNAMAGQMSLFDFVAEEDKKDFEIRMPDVEEYDKEQLLAFEKEVLGVYISGHPLEKYEKMWQKNISATTMDFAYQEELHGSRLFDGAEEIIGGMVEGITIKHTKNNKTMVFLTIEDLLGTVEVVVFPRQYEIYRNSITQDGKLFIQGHVSAEEEKASKLISDKIWKFEDLPKELWIQFSDRESFMAEEKALYEILRSSDGTDQVVVYIRSPKSMKRLGKAWSICADETLLQKIVERYGQNNVKVVEKCIENNGKMN